MAPWKEEGKEKYIHRMFTDLCEEYDKASSSIAFGKDRYWRDYAASLVNGAGNMILDVCCGTGALSIRLVEKTGARVFAFDFCEAMVQQAKKKYGKNGPAGFGVADVEKLPFQDETFTCVTVAFALRNVKDIHNAISEMYRVLKKGGKMVILDLGKPGPSFFGSAYYCYFYYLAPKIGSILTKKGSYAYRYLPHSLTNFPAQTGIKKIMVEIGLIDVEIHDLTKGVAAVHVGTKAG